MILDFLAFITCASTAGVVVRFLLVHILAPDFPQAERHSETDIVALPAKNLIHLLNKLWIKEAIIPNSKFLI